jgi:hypothetical protein
MRRLLFHRAGDAPALLSSKLHDRAGTERRQEPLLRDKSALAKHATERCGNLNSAHHGFVKRIIMRPYFGQARANLPCEL